MGMMMGGFGGGLGGMGGGFSGGFGAPPPTPAVAPQPTFAAGSFSGGFSQPQPAMQGAMGVFSKFAGVMQQQMGASRAASDVMAAAERNAQISRLNADRKLDELSRDIISMTSTQRSQMGATGFSASSKSFQAIMNSTLDSFTRDILDIRADAKREQEGIYYEANQRASAIRQQARGSAFNSLISLFR